MGSCYGISKNYTIESNILFFSPHIYYSNLFIQVSQIKSVDENTPPPIPIFDKNKYRFPNSKKIQIPTSKTLDSGNILYYYHNFCLNI
jgi:hypothetical protein